MSSVPKEKKASEVMAMENAAVPVDISEDEAVRNAAKAAGISHWHTKGIDRLKEELKEIEQDSNPAGQTVAKMAPDPDAKLSLRERATKRLKRVLSKRDRAMGISDADYDALVEKRFNELEPVLASKTRHQRHTSDRLRQYAFEMQAIANGVWSPGMKAPMTAQQKDTVAIRG
eukprot:GHVR01153776.1.p1 GENE.GHVR01153776.1~~GHVR01153776.1.p1  ORF type:complete len:173 (-),score=16.85 GHVR01153776.1:171-689(-)